MSRLSFCLACFDDHLDPSSALLARHPETWTRDEVSQWIDWCTSEFSLPKVVAKGKHFEMNGKYFCFLYFFLYFFLSSRPSKSSFNCDKSKHGGIQLERNSITTLPRRRLFHFFGITLTYLPLPLPLRPSQLNNNILAPRNKNIFFRLFAQRSKDVSPLTSVAVIVVKSLWLLTWQFDRLFSFARSSLSFQTRQGSTSPRLI